jgi:hypothetical protein
LEVGAVMHEGAQATRVVRAERIELHDERGRPRVVVGRLGEGDGAVYGIEVAAADPSLRACLSAEDASAGLTVERLGETVVECRVSTREGEAPVIVEIGAAGCVLARIEVADDGRVLASLPPDLEVRRSAG